RALLLVGFAGAFRRSELVALDRSDITFDSDGARVLIHASKTDQEAAGAVVGLPYGEQPETCPGARAARLAGCGARSAPSRVPTHEPLGHPHSSAADGPERCPDL